MPLVKKSNRRGGYQRAVTVKMLVGKIAAAVICVLALIVTFRTENVLKTVFRVENPEDNVILRTKFITLCAAAALFVLVMIIFK